MVGLSKLGVPDSVTFGVGTVYRCIPLLTEEGTNINIAMETRGISRKGRLKGGPSLSSIQLRDQTIWQLLDSDKNFMVVSRFVQLRFRVVAVSWQNL